MHAPHRGYTRRGSLVWAVSLSRDTVATSDSSNVVSAVTISLFLRIGPIPVRNLDPMVDYLNRILKASFLATLVAPLLMFAVANYVLGGIGWPLTSGSLVFLIGLIFFCVSFGLKWNLMLCMIILPAAAFLLRRTSKRYYVWGLTAAGLCGALSRLLAQSGPSSSCMAIHTC